jgi:hypothetical protein
MPDSGLFITLTIRDPNGGKVLELKKVGLEFGLRRVEEVMQQKYGRQGVRRREDVIIPSLVELCDLENAP